MTEPEEDGDEIEFPDERASTRQWLRDQSYGFGDLGGMLAHLEGLAQPFYLGLDYDSDLSDLDEAGPF